MIRKWLGSNSDIWENTCNKVGNKRIKWKTSGEQRETAGNKWKPEWRNYRESVSIHMQAVWTIRCKRHCCHFRKFITCQREGQRPSLRDSHLQGHCMKAFAFAPRRCPNMEKWFKIHHKRNLWIQGAQVNQFISFIWLSQTISNHKINKINRLFCFFCDRFGKNF